MGAQPEYDVMERILKDSTSEEARSLTADVLIGLPGKRSSKALMQAVYDISTDIRLKASRELVARQYEPAIEVLEALVSHDIADQLPYQIALAEILAEGGYKSGLEFLLRHLNDEEQGTVLAVVSALGKAGGAAEADTLEQLAAKTDNTDIAEAARQAAQQIHDRLGK
jgi:HEAT repeat protein